ncbi:MAG TPA: acyl-CoA thioesterase [Proteobacteria bacterium]|nr:acyl-CoA thioesterase [Pseudomonadota bacterium]
MIRTPFKSSPQDPAPLHFSVQRRVRFEEVDALGIVWHGRFPSYLEDVREALGDHFGIGYLDFFKQGVVAPIRRLQLDYHLPLRFQEEITITGTLHWSAAARLNFSYRIFNARHELSTSGHSVQMMLDSRQNSVLMTPPPFYLAFLENWRNRGRERSAHV